MTDIHRLGTEQTKIYALAAGAVVEIDADLDQVLIKELDGAAEIGLEVNHGPLSAQGAFKGKELVGAIRHLRFTNNSAAAVALQLVMVKGLASKDNRLTQVGDVGVQPQPFSTFQPVGAFTIPARTIQQVASADDQRNRLILVNRPGQFRELYISGAAIAPPAIAVVNGGFETGDLTGWTNVDVVGPAVADAATTANSDPHGGTFYARCNTDPAGKRIRQEIDLLSAGFSADQIDQGNLTLTFSGWVVGEDGSNDGGRLEVAYLDGSAGTLDTDATANTITGAGAYAQVTLNGTIPALTRTLRLDVVFVTNAGGGTLAGWDDLTASIGSAVPEADELAGLIMPAQMVEIPTDGALYVFNPHVGSQVVLVGEVR